MDEKTKAHEYLKFIDTLKNEYERGFGILKVGKNGVTLPLDSVDINARVVGRVVEVTVTQVFQNPYSEHLEAEYVFPLSGCASVNSFKMLVGGRTVTGTIQERRAAREQYAQALNEGRRVSLLEQERDDVFTIQVGNIPPAERVSVELSYVEKLQYFEDGTTELRLPLVVAPRYIPGNPVAREAVGNGVLLDTDEVPDASRISPPRLAAGVLTDVSLSISVELNAALLSSDKIEAQQAGQIAGLSCSQHAVQSSTANGITRVTLCQTNEILNRDFVLRWRVVRKTVTSSVVLFREPAGTEGRSLNAYAMLSLLPPLSNDIPAPPRDIIFLIDRSGSMSGEKMNSAASACSIMLSTVGPNDRFAIAAFDDVMEWFQSKAGITDDPFIQGDEVGIERGIKYLKSITARGGTELAPALSEALKLTRKTQECGRVPTIVILTDGQVGNESTIYKLAQKHSGDTRIFTIGIDSAVNGAFLQKLASLAGGTSLLVEPGGQLESALVQISREVGAPLITDLTIENLTEGVTLECMAPRRLPDLFERRMSDCLFRLNLPGQAVIPRFLIKGKFADGREFRQQISARIVTLEAVPRLWAREYIKELEEQFRRSPGQQSLKDQIIQLSLKFSILTKFTAFVAIDDQEVVNTTGEVRQVVQPVHVPEQWQQPGSQSVGIFGLDNSSLGGAISQAFFDQSCSGWGANFQERCRDPFQSAKSSDDGYNSGSSNWELPEQEFSGSAAAPQTPPQVTPPENGFKLRKPPARGLYEKGQNTSWDKWRAYTGNSDSSQSQNKTPDPGPAALWPAMKKLIGSRSNESQSETPETSPLRRIINALESFRQLWQQSWKEVCEGRLPEAAPVECARKELLQALSDHPVGFELPLLQRHLRLSAKGFVVALQTPEVTADVIFRLRSKLNYDYENALIEADSALNQLAGRQGAFWESTV